MLEAEALFEPVVEVARRLGVWAELWGEITEGLSVERRDRRLHAVEPYRETVLAVRVIHRGRMGLAYTTRAEPEAVREAAERAWELARFSEEEGTIPEPESLPELTENTVVRSGPEDLLRRLEEAEAAALAFDPRVHRLERSVLAWSETRHFIFQTGGLAASYRKGGYTFMISLTAREGRDERSAWEWREAPDLDGLDLAELSRKAAARATDLLSAERMSSRRLAVLFPPQVAVSLLETLASSFCGDEVARGRSRLSGKLGKRLFSPTIHLVDDGLLAGGPETRPFDDEGVPQRKTLLVSEGTISAFLYDTRWGLRSGKGSTGNARRASFKSLPTVSPTNLYLFPGGESPESLRQDGVFEVYEILGWHTTDPVSGDFSVGVSGVLHASGGSRPVAGLALSGNLFDLLARVSVVSSDLTFYGEVGSPSLLIPDLDLSGA